MRLELQELTSNELILIDGGYQQGAFQAGEVVGAFLGRVAKGVATLSFAALLFS